jgi:hypothetical protein
MLFFFFLTLYLFFPFFYFFNLPFGLDDRLALVNLFYPWRPIIALPYYPPNLSPFNSSNSPLVSVSVPTSTSSSSFFVLRNSYLAVLPFL